MSKREGLLGWCYLGFQFFILPEILMLCNSLLPKPLGYTQLNSVAFVINFVAVAVIFRRFLWHGLIVACGNLWNTIKTAFLAFCVSFIAFSFTRI